MTSEEIYTSAQIRSVLAICPSSPTGIRDAALVFLLWVTGLRAAEACALLPGDLDFRGTAWVRRGKGGKSRRVVVPGASLPELHQRIARWMTHRQPVARDDSPLFCNLQGNRLDESYLRRMFAERATAARLKVRFHPHGLRHTHAATLHLHGISLTVIQQQLGHADVSMTGTYLRRIPDSYIFEFMRDFSVSRSPGDPSSPTRNARAGTPRRSR